MSCCSSKSKKEARHRAEGDKKFQQKEYQGAVDEYTKAVEANPKYVPAIAHRGVVRSVLGQYDESIKDFNRTIELNPHDDFAYHNRGKAKASLSKWAEAVADYDMAIHLNSGHYDAYIDRGIAQRKLGKQQEAIADFNKSLELNPTAGEAFHNRGISYQEQGRLEDAEKDFTSALETIKSDAGIFNGRGQLRLLLLKYSEAVTDFEQATNLNANLPLAHLGKAIAYQKLGGNDTLAQKEVETALKLDNKLGKAHQLLGELLFQKGEWQNAINSLNRALEQDPHSVQAYAFRGQSYFKLEKYQEALNDFNHILKPAAGTQSPFDQKTFEKELYVIKVKLNKGTANLLKTIAGDEELTNAWIDHIPDNKVSTQ